ncbi:glucose 1-dehydrogenase [Burkholderia multivorans]|uniref:SDR family NAD(P)-dependent oxidoreductase n=1 Tax=Burkholderia multivorans TaxID=87883 RepID=UPI000277CA7E|nr:glucose 1-dehydrogenase [Burkholderia multivorans]AJY16353.1 short chain dehydrogenase family protein [Burkholderia multivorans ATCC BAA-247]AVR19790.1 3-oxoacyl-ACP reductase [Burkholderia multivorans]EJO54447.1 KR domain protein [Burkholderia multivorans ATCC BAA-247]MBU9495762.1 glucose 1-dehydrogenase [Burkholderia multivorans]MCA8246244.1 glucose 1-dehydrogenase [Burkholderia multivorans]
MLLENRIIVVTGAASPRGIGKATAQALAAQGARIAILDLREEDARAAAADLGSGHLGLACDVADKAACVAAARATLERYGRIDGLVNNAGITQPVRTLDIGAKDFDAIVDVNLRGTLYMSQAVIPAMKEQQGGSIVCMSSVSAQRGGGIFGGPHYSAAKAGVLGLAKAMAREFGPDRIRVNAIAPGLIQTDITGDKLTPDMRADIVKGIPLGRLGDAADVANACLFLVSDLSTYLTGITLDVNGGMLIH